MITLLHHETAWWRLQNEDYKVLIYLYYDDSIIHQSNLVKVLAMQIKLTGYWVNLRKNWKLKTKISRHKEKAEEK